MTIDEGCEQAAIHEAGNGDVMRSRCKSCDNFTTIDITLQLVSGRVVTPASEAVRKIVWVQILNCAHIFLLLRHSTPGSATPNI